MQPGRLRTTAWASIFAFVGVYALVSAPRSAWCQNISPASGVPTLDQLPHRPLPEGERLRWCGHSGRFLMGRKDKYGIYWIEGAGGEDFRLDGYVDCNAAGDTLIVFNDCSIKTVSLADRTERLIVAYKARAKFPGCSFADIAISPDLRHVGFDAGLVEPQGEQIDGIAVSASPGGRRPNSLLWSADSSQLFNIMTADDATSAKPLHHATVQVIDVGSGTERRGDLPGAVAESGVVLRNGKEVLLFMRPSINDVIADPGSVVSCRIADPISCRTIITNVDEVSFSDNGVITFVKSIYKDPKHRTDGDVFINPVAYAVDVRSAGGKVIASQRGKGSVGLTVSPSGAEAAVIWSEWCATPDGRGKRCSSGSIVSFAGRR